jgi:hypothetical protein
VGNEIPKYLKDNRFENFKNFFLDPFLNFDELEHGIEDILIESLRNGRKDGRLIILTEIIDKYSDQYNNQDCFYIIEKSNYCYIVEYENAIKNSQ